MNIPRSLLHPRISGVFFALVLLLVPMVSWAVPIVLVPTGLSAGDTYQLVFVTSTARDATSSDITVYDAFVQAAANVAGGGLESITWKAIASTSSVDAFTNAGVGVLTPVYRLDNVLFASGSNDMWDGDPIPYAALEINELGETVDSFVWTGSYEDGDYADVLGSSDPTVGESLNDDDAEWIDATTMGSSEELPLYAISTVLTVPGGTAVVPEPSSLLLFGTGLLGLVGWAARRRKAGQRL